MKTNDKRLGSAIVTVMMVLTLLGTLIASIAYSSTVRAVNAQRLVSRIKATAIAEAGVAQVYSVLATNWAARFNTFSAVNYGGGTYCVSVTPDALNSNRVVLVSTGQFSVVTASVVADLCNYGASGGGGGSSPPQGGLGAGADAFDYAMVSGGNMTFVGNMDMQISNAWFHANGTMTGNGQQWIRGNVSSSTSIDFPHINGIANAPTVSGDVGTELEGAVSPVIIPDIDLTPYYNVATNNFQVFSGTKSLSGTVTVPGGVMWVNGNIAFGAGTFTGCFIATGNITTGTGNDNYTFRKVNQYPILVCRDGNMIWQGGNKSLVDFQGLIYLKTGIFDKQGNGDVFGRGSIIAAGGISKNGGWGGMLYEDSTPVPPGGGGGGGGETTPVDLVGLTAWQK